jgi:type IV pilus assembly protein PilQ
MAKILKPTLGWLAVLAWSGAALCAGESKTTADPKAAEGKTAVIVPAGSTQRAASPEARTSPDFKGESLKLVLDFLSTRSGVNIRVLDDKDLDIKVTFSLDNVSWREILSFLAEKYGLIVDDSREAQGLIVVKSPPKVSIIFDKPTDIRTVIATIADQSGANIIIGSDKEITGKVSLSLKDVPWEEALNMVVRTLNFVAVKDKFNTYRITTPDKLAQQLETRVFRLSYIQPEGSRYMATIQSEFVKKEEVKASGAAGGAGGEPTSLLNVLKSIATDKAGKINYVRDSNTLVITDTPTKLEAMQRLIEKMDVPPKQVHMVVRMVELSDTESEELGVEWANQFASITSGMSFDTTFPFKSRDNTSQYLRGDSWRWLGITGDKSTNGVLSFVGMQATLHFFKTRTKASVIQAPSLTALDNQEATIHVGRNIRYAEFDSNSTNSGTSSGFKEAQNSPIKEGIQILLIPHVTGPDGNVLMTIVAKNEIFDEFRNFGGATGIDLPQTRQRIVVTKELLRDTETGVIAGLKQASTQTTETKLPVLGDIPVLGWLFKSRVKPSERNYQTNLLIFVTPTVIDLEQDGRVPKAVREIRHGLAGPFFTYDEKAGEEEPVKAGSGK